jgi:hypothetical protein
MLVHQGPSSPEWPDEFVKESPKMLPNPFFVLITYWNNYKLTET